MVENGFMDIDGGRLYYERDGDGPALLLSGGALDVRMWEYQIEALSQDYSFIRCDLRGYGRSSLPSDQRDRHCDDLRVLVDGLGLERVCIGGQSLGGTVALDFALAHPDVVAGVILAPPLPVLGWDWVEGFPVKPAIEAGLRGGAVDYMADISALADARAADWARHPCYGDDGAHFTPADASFRHHYRAF